ncbi:MAG: hypothetical protein SFV51_19955 [Bryobacteraceae bacterium]|nr:hypothetical protein [Bryobacteraceae bacterium]
MRKLAAILLTLAAMPLAAEQRMNRGDGFERLVVIVPLVGRGTYEDPVRPLYVPARQQAAPDGVISFNYQLTDDGKRAVVELVALNRRAFAQILAERRPDVKVFEPGKVTKAFAEAEIRKEKRDFSSDRLSGRAR